MFFPEHSHIPVSRETDYPDSYGGGVLPDFYKRTYDPFISCAFAAAATTSLEVGTGICLLALRDAVHTAKLVASVDRLSGGRFTFGVGFGWNQDEFVTHGADWKTRHRKVREQVALMRDDVDRGRRQLRRRVRQPRAQLVLAEAGPGARARRSTSVAAGR